MISKTNWIYQKKQNNYDEADCYLLNTCHIKIKQKKKSIMKLEELKRFLDLKKTIVKLLQVVLLSRKSRNVKKKNQY
jgi:tRNA A37 methylthiotransferase MiaB